MAELIDGSIYMSPAPTPQHQRIIGKLYRILTGYIEHNNLGEILISPCDVFLDETANVVQPDLIFIAADNSSLVQNDAIHGVPDMLLEILSPGNSRHDLVRKKELYERFGVKEYWIINPDTREVTGFLLKAGKYGDALQLTAKIKSALLQHEFDF